MDGWPMIKNTSQPKPKSLFRVTFRDGATLTTKATCSVLAEKIAVQTRPGAVKKITFIKKVTNG
jgi:hypothetical protein